MEKSQSIKSGCGCFVIIILLVLLAIEIVYFIWAIAQGKGLAAVSALDFLFVLIALFVSIAIFSSYQWLSDKEK